MTTKRKILIGISWLLAAACMTVIFMLSAQVADESAELSMQVMSGFFAIFTKLEEFIGHDAFRTLAHALEYCGLGLLLFNAFYHTFSKPKVLISFAASVFYALTDEIHQLFVEGRAFQISDLAVDAAGSLVGVIAGHIIYIIINYILKHRRGK